MKAIYENREIDLVKQANKAKARKGFFIARFYNGFFVSKSLKNLIKKFWDCSVIFYKISDTQDNRIILVDANQNLIDKYYENLELN